MAKKRKGEIAAFRTPTLCGRCMGPIDRAAIAKAIRENTEYVHACGRVLVKAR